MSYRYPLMKIYKSTSTLDLPKSRIESSRSTKFPPIRLKSTQRSKVNLSSRRKSGSVSKIPDLGIKSLNDLQIKNKKTGKKRKVVLLGKGVMTFNANAKKAVTNKKLKAKKLKSFKISNFVKRAKKNGGRDRPSKRAQMVEEFATSSFEGEEEISKESIKIQKTLTLPAGLFEEDEDEFEVEKRHKQARASSTPSMIRDCEDSVYTLDLSNKHNTPGFSDFCSFRDIGLGYKL